MSERERDEQMRRSGLARDPVSVCCGARVIMRDDYHMCGKCSRTCLARPWDGGDVKREPTMSDAEWAKRTETQERDKETALMDTARAARKDVCGYFAAHLLAEADDAMFFALRTARAEGIEQGAREQRERDAQRHDAGDRLTVEGLHEFMAANGYTDKQRGQVTAWLCGLMPLWAEPSEDDKRWAAAAIRASGREG